MTSQATDRPGDPTPLTATERAVIAGLLAPEEQIESDAIMCGEEVWAALRAKFPATLFRQWAAEVDGRYGFPLDLDED